MRFENKGQKPGQDVKLGEEQELYPPTQSDGQDKDSAEQKSKKNVGARKFHDGSGTR